MKPCGHRTTVWCACYKHSPYTSVLYEITHVGGIPLDPPVPLYIRGDATPEQFEKAVVDRLANITTLGNLQASHG